MNIREDLLALQWRQLKHDENYHKDIALLSIPERVKHMALHCAKYVGYFFQAEANDDGKRLKQVLIDAFIINLATANALNQDLGTDLGEEFHNQKSLMVVGLALAAKLNRNGEALWLIRNYAEATGQLAKLCESWDHMENLSFRSGMKECNSRLFKLVVAEAASLQIDLLAAYSMRIREVEARSMFDVFMQDSRGS